MTHYPGSAKRSKRPFWLCCCLVWFRRLTQGAEALDLLVLLYFSAVSIPENETCLQLALVHFAALCLSFCKSFLTFKLECLLSALPLFFSALFSFVAPLFFQSPSFFFYFFSFSLSFSLSSFAFACVLSYYLINFNLFYSVHLATFPETFVALYFFLLLCFQ